MLDSLSAHSDLSLCQRVVSYCLIIVIILLLERIYDEMQTRKQGLWMVNAEGYFTFLFGSALNTPVISRCISFVIDGESTQYFTCFVKFMNMNIRGNSPVELN